MTETKEEERFVEFNTGFISALSKFYGHRFQFGGLDISHDSRLYAASDHLFDIEIPDSIPRRLKTKIKKWTSKCLDNRLGFGSDENKQKEYKKLVDSLFDECDDILMELDKHLFKLKVEWSYR